MRVWGKSAVAAITVATAAFALSLAAGAGQFNPPKPKLPAGASAEAGVREPKLAPPLLEISPEAPVAATLVNVNTIWGKIPFAQETSFQSETKRGTGFSLNVPTDWTESTGKHPVIGGTQYRYTSENALTSVVVVVFPLDDAEDMAAYLAGKQMELLTSFKNQAARQMILGRKTGIGCFYQGVLFMRDVCCHLFLTRQRGKGFLVYGFYFDAEGGKQVSQTLASLRLF